MTVLYFSRGDKDGFTSKKLADQKDGYLIPIRELLQNSLDASVEANNKKLEVNVVIEEISKNNIPHIKEYEETLKKAIKYHEDNKSLRDNSKRIVKSIEAALKSKSIKVLMFTDNGIGMDSDKLDALISGQSKKASEGSRGSFGVGHFSSYFLSSLRYVLYASKYKEDNAIKKIFSGAPILAGYVDENDYVIGNTGRILTKKPVEEKQFEFVLFPEKFPSFIEPRMDEINTGSMVAILGLKEDWNHDASYAIASNFFYAIYNNQISVSITTPEKNHLIEKDSLEKILFDRQDGKRAQKEAVLADKYVYQSWLTVRDGEEHSIELENGEKVNIYISNNIEADSVIAIARGGMLVARHDSMLSTHMENLRKEGSPYESFSLFINIEESTCPKLYKLVKGAEGPYHNSLDQGRLEPDEEKNLKVLFKEISKKVKDFLVEKDVEAYPLALFPIDGEADIKNPSNSKHRGESDTSKPIKPKPRKPIGPIKPGKGRKRKKPSIATRVMPAGMNVKIKKDYGDTVDVVVNIMPKKNLSRDEVYFSVSLAEDNDYDSSSTALEFISVTLDGNGVLIPKPSVDNSTDNTQINLGRLTTAKNYLLEAKVKKPSRVANIPVALKPFLGLKQSKDLK